MVLRFQLHVIACECIKPCGIVVPGNPSPSAATRAKVKTESVRGAVWCGSLILFAFARFTEKHA